MDVILLERIAKLGQMGDIVTVKDGFARNFLLPQGKALRANKANKEVFERDRAQLEARNLEAKSEAQAVADKLEGESFVIIRQAGDTGQLYGSVSTRDIAETVTENGFSANRNQILLDRPIKALGLHEMNIQLHPEVEAGVIVNVARSEDEAERQARGEDVNAFDDDDDDEDVLDAEEVFEEGAGELAEDGDADAEAGERAEDDTA
ncbi:MAG: 50S ribosomal protein L9 [Pseudomonadota bacterium]